MENRQNITAAQLVLLTTGSAIMYPYVIMPVLSAPPANQDTWIATILAVVFIMLMGIPSFILMNKFRGFNFNQTVEMISGRIIGKVFLFLFVAFFLFCNIACTLIIVVFVKLYVIQQTPEWAIILIIGVPVTYGAYKGAGVIGKISLFIVTAMVFSVLIFFLMAIFDVKIDTIMPVLADSSFYDIVLGAFLTASRYSDILIFFVFSYYLMKNVSLKKCFFSGITLFGIVFFIIVFSTLLKLGPSVAKNEWNPYFVFTRQLETYDFLRRMQSLNVLVWFPLGILKLMIYVYMIGLLLENIFKTKSHRPFVFSVSVLTFLFLVSGVLNKTSILEYLKSDALFPYIVLTVSFILPFLLLMIYISRKKNVDKTLEKMKKQQQKEQSKNNEDENGESSDYAYEKDDDDKKDNGSNDKNNLFIQGDIKAKKERG